MASLPNLHGVTVGLGSNRNNATVDALLHLSSVLYATRRFREFVDTTGRLDWSLED